ncbi:MAG: HAD family hydrolase [Balneolaceae bacterium]|nr:HAD family hydrolase [Balneolaceae bacterium]
MQKTELLERIKSLTSPVYPNKFGHKTNLKKLEGINCVAFDFYGTMFISGIGDISVDEEQKQGYQEIINESLQSTGFSITKSSTGKAGLEQFKLTIDRHIQRKKEEGIDYPEPDIIAVWSEVLAALLQQNFIEGPIKKEHAIRFAIEFEFRANDIWPVPQLDDVLQQLLNRNLKLGILSNSQFYTPLAFEALIGQSTDDYGFDPDLQKWSYRCGIKKPSLYFYRQFTSELSDKEIKPQEVLYVGNDLFKDIIPARKLQMKTALYVGDRRSLRHEERDLKNGGYQPDIIIDDLQQIIDCLDR